MLIIGLGNPGGEYQKHRHNVGFMFLEYLRQAHFAPIFKKASFKAGGGALLSEFHYLSTKIRLLLPMGYMNRSGIAVQAALDYFDLSSQSMLVVHDELDLPFARMRVKFAGGAGGHNGLRSIDQLVGKDYWRVRIGIDHPGHKDMVSNYVLSNFSKAEMQSLPEIFTFLAESLPLYLKGEHDQFIAQTGGFRLNIQDERKLDGI